MSSSNGTSSTTRVAVVGATGAVGAELLLLLESRERWSEVLLFAGDNTSGTYASFRGADLPVKPLDASALGSADIVFWAAPAGSLAPLLTELSVDVPLIVDLSGLSERMGAPVVVPEVNGDAMESVRPWVVSPMGAVPPIALVVDGLRDLGVPQRLVTTLLIPASERGRSGMAELGEQAVGLLNQKDFATEQFGDRLAFNLLPVVDGDGEGDGSGDHSTAEVVFARQIQAVLEEPELTVDVTAVRVPVFSGQAAVLTVDLGTPMTAAAVAEKLGGMDGLEVSGPAGGDPADLSRVGETDEVYVGRIRVRPENPATVSMWVAWDNLRKGSALNALQIAEAFAQEAGWPMGG